MLGTPKVNSGIKDAINDLTKKKDGYQQITQMQLGTALGAFGQAFSDILNNSVTISDGPEKKKTY